MTSLIGELYNHLNSALASLLEGEKEDFFSERDLSVSPDSPHYNRINTLRELIISLDKDNNEIEVKKLLDREVPWALKRRYPKNEFECQRLAVIMYFSIGFDNARELLLGNYGQVDYEMISYLFADFEIIKSNGVDVAYFAKDEKSIEAFRNFLFSNKKDSNNAMRLMLKGELIELFVNFDYFFNSLEYFIQKLGFYMNRKKLISLLEERYIAPVLENPELGKDILEDMVESYHNRYGISESDSEIIDKNMDAYRGKLKSKTSSSIKKVDIPDIGIYSVEMLPLSDARNLVMGYRAGNCFRLNGEAAILFNKFLTNPHMRLLSISTDGYKDFGMVLLMRNGNVLIAQGIETSRRAPKEILGEKLYLAVQSACEHIMNQMNEDDDEIVATIIGLTNENTRPYNSAILPFIARPILDNSDRYYTGIDNYQALLVIKDGKSISDMKSFVPNKRYSESDNKIWRRDKNTPRISFEYRMIEKILISLRYEKFQHTSEFEMIWYYNELCEKKEDFTICTSDWFITKFCDGSVDSFIKSNDPEVVRQFNEKLSKIKGNQFK